MAFWGLVLEPKKSYTQREVEQPFHISMAALDLQNCDPNDQSVSVVCRKRDSDFILCNLSKSKGVFNVPLNLDFELGGEINFHVLGNSAVHLTGYIIEDYNLDSDESMGEEEDEEEEEADNDIFKNTKKALEAAKRKKDSAPQNKAKKAKLEQAVEEEEDEDDSDFEMEDSDDEGEEVEEEEDDDDDEDEDEDDEAEVPAPSPKGETKKDKKQAKNQQAANATPKGAAKQDQKQGKNQPKGQTPQNKATNGTQQQANGKPTKQTIQGVQIEDIKVGTGPVAKLGKNVCMYYVGRLKNGKQFDATTSGKGFQFRLGRGEVIKGWDVGIQGMQVGGKRRLVIPPKLAYGEKGAGGAIPPNATLTFEVELKKVN
ncbi:hypothetical protein ONE63_008290 [Megalurothrips usitatus]|uniref:FK506-binding protein n=1 Tax=Megalurothrips usitatus TaxID=439358 RepID=A0AAV7XS90_9NEOP|nr:hypothetical protein ONE63_008290 [Megalurothrips usitatus]